MVPDITPLLQAAQARGAGIVRGREMLSQGVESMAEFLGMAAYE
jgi:shikimate 5-dehydrogenase